MRRGFALVVVLVGLLMITASSASLIWFMQQAQTRAGLRYRSAAALAVAEAGVYQALSVLESVSPDGRLPGRFWRPRAHGGAMRVGPMEGRFTLSISDEPGEVVVIISAGEVAGVTRRLRARAHLASAALLASLNGAGFVRLERPPGNTSALPYGPVVRDRPWIHLAAGRGLWLAAGDVSVNNASAGLEGSPGPLDEAMRPPETMRRIRPMPAGLVMPPGVEVSLDPDRRPIDVQQLRVMGVNVRGEIFRTEALARFPEVDRAYYAAMATANVANADVNRAAGGYLGDSALAQKRDSLYSQWEFDQLQRYLTPRIAPTPLAGIVYVKGRAVLSEGQRMRITNGALVAEGSVLVSPGASLEITHSADTRTLPGVITLDNGPLIVARGARLRVHGLIYASRIIYVGEDARVDVVGTILGGDPEISIRNTWGVIVVRYDTAVLGTPGLRVPDGAPVIAWVSAWEELP